MIQEIILTEDGRGRRRLAYASTAVHRFSSLSAQWSRTILSQMPEAAGRRCSFLILRCPDAPDRHYWRL